MRRRSRLAPRRPTGALSGGRDLAVDATRGVAIWSMISLHFSAGTIAARPTHLFPYVDGMSAFVLLSGLVLGIVYQRWIGRFGLGYAYRRIGKRLFVLYLCQLLISLAAVAASYLDDARTFRRLAILPPGPSLGTKLEWSFTLRYLPSGGNILLLYLILMGLAALILPIMARRLWPLVLGASLVLFAATMIWPTGTHGTGPTTIQSFPGGPPIQNWAAWQVLFIPALVIGWKWDAWRVPERIDRFLAPLLMVTLIVGITVEDLMMMPSLRPHLVLLVDKVDLGPVRAVLAFLVVTCVYGVFRVVLRWLRRDLLRPLVATGARSLDSYVLQALCLLAVPTLIVDRPWKPSLAVAIAVAVFAACWVWAEIRTRLGVDKLHRAPMLLAASVQHAWVSSRNGGLKDGEQRDEPAGQAQAGIDRRTDVERSRRESRRG
ncbi:MAG: OpgC domain-containing protein [Gordonia sp. (in: high G+C Gram-positive bacteria)]|uniref:OpgC domain-containing protein n=1 Tax=Gordonia sp. (in: high G+C Gram-positive bacteria) TaxID=84139 RepID=UPI003C76F653